MTNVMRVIAALAVMAALACAPVGFAQSEKKGADQTRVVEGVVTNPDGTPSEGAVAYLENTKTLQIRSFITPATGAYSFRGLNSDVDYAIHAEHPGMGPSDSKTISTFDSRKDILINLKLTVKKN